LLQIHPDPDPATGLAVADLGPFPGASALAEAAGADSEEAPGARPMEAWLGGEKTRTTRDPSRSHPGYLQLDIKISGVGQTEI